MEWSDLKLILAICQEQTLTGAAKKLGLNHSTVFRRLNAIEEKMNVRFFERLPHGYEMTEAGRLAKISAERVEKEILDLDREILGQDLRLQGNIKITAPEGISNLLLVPIIGEFSQQHPHIRIQMEVGSVPLELARRQADMAVRVTSKPPDTSLGRRISLFRFCVYATKDYMAANPNKMIADHQWIMIDDEFDWVYPHLWKSKQEAEDKIRFSSSTIWVAMHAAEKNLGVILLPCFIGDRNPNLQRIGEPVESLTMECWLLTHADLRHTARVKALMSHVYDRMQKHIPALEGHNE